MNFELSTQIFCGIVLFLIALVMLGLAVMFRNAEQDPTTKQVTQEEVDRKLQEAVQPMRDKDLRAATEEWMEDNWPCAQDVINDYRDDEDG